MKNDAQRLSINDVKITDNTRADTIVILQFKHFQPLLHSFKIKIITWHFLPPRVTVKTVSFAFVIDRKLILAQELMSICLVGDKIKWTLSERREKKTFKLSKSTAISIKHLKVFIIQ